MEGRPTVTSTFHTNRIELNLKMMEMHEFMFFTVNGAVIFIQKKMCTILLESSSKFYCYDCFERKYSNKCKHRCAVFADSTDLHRKLFQG